MENNDADLERVWKEFGKHTEAGKLLYNIYGSRYRPEKHIHYPKLILKTPEMKEQERREKERQKLEKQNKIAKAANKIDYSAGLRQYQRDTYNPYGRVDYIPHRRNENQIKYELEMMKRQMNQKVKTNSRIGPNRKEQIMKLQDKFEFQERTVMPKGARMPGIKMDEQQEIDQKNKIHNEMQAQAFNKNDKRAELERLYNGIVNEIDERYKYMSEMKQLGKNEKSVIKNEIKERINEMKTVQKLIEDDDSKKKE